MGETTNDLPPSIKLTRRATANALWTPLRRALTDKQWPLNTTWEHHDPRGNPHSTDLTTGGVPGPLPTYTPTNDKGRIITRLAPDQWPGNGLILTARLTEDDYDMIHAQLTMTEMYEWANAWVHSTARRPFLQETNRHGNPTLRRNHDPGALITPLVADFLTTLAFVADVQLLTPQEEAEHQQKVQQALLDEEVKLAPRAGPMRPAVALAIAERSGVTCDE